MSDVLVRIGMPAITGALINEAPPGAALLVSANAFWSREKREFRSPIDKGEKDFLRDQGLLPAHARVPSRLTASLPRLWDRMAYGTALDSAGFVAMKLYGGEYPWTVEQYVDFAVSHPWDWYAAMDYCCEPEIAADRSVVARRVTLTAERLGDCLAYASHLRDYEGMNWISDAMPVLQGWLPSDYRRCAELVDRHLTGGWPDLVGVGSVCRRQLGGPDGLVKILAALDLVLPSHVKLHLFGVKSSALRSVASHPRIASMDSCAWDFAARSAAYWRRRDEIARGVPDAEQTKNTVAFRGSIMRQWIAKQIKAAERSQLDLFA